MSECIAREQAERDGDGWSSGYKREGRQADKAEEPRTRFSRQPADETYAVGLTIFCAPRYCAMSQASVSRMSQTSNYYLRAQVLRTFAQIM